MRRVIDGRKLPEALNGNVAIPVWEKRCKQTLLGHPKASVELKTDPPIFDRFKSNRICTVRFNRVDAQVSR